MIDPKVKLTLTEKVERLIKKLGRIADKERIVIPATFCGASDRGMFICSRPEGHDDMHIALAGDYVCHTWRADVGRPKSEKTIYDAEDVDRMIEELGEFVNKQRYNREGHLCNQSDRGMWACSREADHTGCHVAVGSELCHVWLNKEQE